MTKASLFITDVKDVAFTIQYAFSLANSGRPGPVWVDIPSNIQTAEMPEKYLNYHGPATAPSQNPVDYGSIKQRIETAERPIVLVGYGVRQSNTVIEFVEFVEIGRAHV